MLIIPALIGTLLFYVFGVFTFLFDDMITGLLGIIAGLAHLLVAYQALKN